MIRAVVGRGQVQVEQVGYLLQSAGRMRMDICVDEGPMGAIFTSPSIRGQVLIDAYNNIDAEVPTPIAPSYVDAAAREAGATAAAAAQGN